MMQWSDDKDLEMMKEMAANGIFSYKSGSRERGQLWQTIATHLNLLDGSLVTKRSVRDRFTTLMRKYKAKMNQEVKGSGTAGDEPSEYEILIEDLIHLSDESDLKQESTAEEKKNTLQIEQQKAIEVRQQAMERIGETKKRLSNDENDTSGTKRSRRSSSDTMEILREKMLRDQELHELRKTERMEEKNLQKVQLEQNSNMVTVLTSSIQQQATQQANNQQNLIQILNQQQQQFQMFMAMFAQNMKDKNN